MKHCQKCDLDFPVAYRFCGSCGESLNDLRRCADCGEVAEGKWAFCTNCGKQLSAGSPAVGNAPTHLPETKTTPVVEPETKKVASHEWYAVDELFDETTQTTAARQQEELAPRAAVTSPAVTSHPQNGNGKAPPTLTMLSAYGESERIAPSKPQGKRGLLFAFLLLVLFGAIGFGGWYLLTRQGSATQSQPSAETSAAPATTDSSLSSTSRATKPLERAIATDPADEEWKRLREKRIGAKPAEASEVINSLAAAEKKYPQDYRFPYERAKLSIKGITSHDEAFSALSAAAERAIDNSKAQEMLDNLNADKDGDFYKLARGHHEWHALLDALTSKDKKELRELHH